MKSLARVLAFLSVATVCLSGCPEDVPPETHGYTCVQVRPSLMWADKVGELFAETTEIRTTVNYGECLKDFYTSTNANYAMDGVEGEEVFAEWQERLCSEEIAGTFVCEVNTIKQNFAGMNANLQISLVGIDPAGIEGFKIPIGPLPLENLSECTSQVSLGSSAVTGYDSNGNQVWSVETFEVNTANAGLDGRGCMTVNVTRD
ncbi:MAG TPA: hypothetical protein ENJ18_04210 [Nannocystis exedens]|nr:hypothetical protein [Nannocystis exedens]